jgi:hypothetical protein
LVNDLSGILKLRRHLPNNSLEGRLVLIGSILFLEYVDVYVQQFHFVGMYRDMSSDEIFHVQLKNFETLLISILHHYQIIVVELCRRIDFQQKLYIVEIWKRHHF